MKAIYPVLLFISAATLAFQVVLTRLFALAQGHHLAFMAVSLALLGIGASGAYLSLRPPTPASLGRTLTGGAALFAATIPASYLAVNYLPFDAYRLALEPSQFLWLGLYYLALTIPFFFGGLITGATFTVHPKKTGQLYAANLLGSALGPLLALIALAAVGGPGAMFLCALLGWLAVVICRVKDLNFGTGLPATIYTLRLILYGTTTILLLYFTLRPPALFEVRLTPYKSLAQALLYPGSQVVFGQWNAFSRVDIIRSDSIHSAPGLSFTYPGALPPQLGLTVDGDNLAPITRPTQTTFTHYLPLALAFELRPKADILILEPGGGLAVLTALQHEVKTITVVQHNHTVSQAMQQQFADFNGQIYRDPRVTLVTDEPRSFLRRTGQQFDLIILPLTDSFRPVTAGAYTLAEDYRYTVEAFSDALQHLTPNGILIVERWLQLPPSESLRLWGTALEALRLSGERRPQSAGRRDTEQLFALRSLQTSLIGVARSPLAVEDIATVRRFANKLQFDPIWLPDVEPEETNRFSVVPGNPYYTTFAGLLAAPAPAAFYAAYPYAVTPPTDDQPFFFHFFKWQQTPEILQALGKTWQPFGGSGYLVLVALLALVVLLSAALILLPLLWQRRGSAKQRLKIEQSTVSGRWPAVIFLYFALLGLGFLFVEIPLLQRFILYLGQPAYAFAVVTAALLAAAGVGSGYLSGKLSLRLALPLVVLLTLVYPPLLSYLFDATLRLPFAGRSIITVLALFPLGLLLGLPFPAGLRLVSQTRPELIPWLWAVNGCASVVSAVLAAMVALTWGFTVVLWSAALAYALAGVILALFTPGRASAAQSAPRPN